MAKHRPGTIALIDSILSLAVPVSVLANLPHAHYTETSSDQLGLLNYLKRNLAKSGQLKGAVLQKHLSRLFGMSLLEMIETLERYFKEVAAACVDFLAGFVHDDRFDIFRVQGSTFAVHFGTDTLGRALCESSTWLDTATINSRFRTLLADPFEDGKFVLFPNNRKDPLPDRERFNALELLWQLRHTQVHNVGIITQSDAIKFRLMVKRPVSAPRQLNFTRDDIVNLKRFLDGIRSRGQNT